VGGEDGPQFGSLAVGQWWGLGNEAFDVRGHGVRVGALRGKHVVTGVGWEGSGLRVNVFSAGLSAAQGQGGGLLSGGVRGLMLRFIALPDCGCR